jgi:hypothetical protein
MLTSGQMSRLTEIAEELKRDPKNHWNENYRKDFEQFTQEQIDGTVTALRRIYADGNGYLAYKVIRAWHDNGLVAVIKLYKNGGLTSSDKLYD